MPRSIAIERAKAPSTRSRPPGPTRNGGSALAAEERHFFERRFGVDFSDVRVHTGTESEREARALGAQAFASGNDVVLGDAHPAVRGPLLAHELAHVAQFLRGGMRPGVDGQRSEYDATRAATAALTVGSGAVNVGSAPAAAIQRLPLDAPSSEVPDLSAAVVAEINALLRAGHRQRAVDRLVDEAVEIGRIDRSQLTDGRVKYDPTDTGEGGTTAPGFHRSATGELRSKPRPVEVGTAAFKWGLSWLYSTILHEYKHVEQDATVTGLPTIESAVPGQRLNSVRIDQRNIEAYAQEILLSKDTGVFANARAMRVLWHRLHADCWMNLGRVDRAPVADLYKRSYAVVSTVPGIGPLPYHPLAP